LTVRQVIISVFNFSIVNLLAILGTNKKFKMRSSAYVMLLAFVLVSCSVLSVAALSKSNHKFLGRIVSRAEETVQNIESLFHNEKPKNATAEPKQWAVLVAGSNGYYNYRHQVNIFLK
jgi:legumain